MIGSPMLAAFVWPALFFGGAGAIAAPILIHFFARRRYRRIRWAATRFLLQAVRRNKRRVWLEDLILLLLRCLAVLLIALLVSRTVHPVCQESGQGGRRRNNDRSAIATRELHDRGAELHHDGGRTA